MLPATLTLVSFLHTAVEPAAGDSRESLLLANCPRQAGEYVGTIAGQLILHRELLAGDDVEASIGHQLRYLWGYYRNDVEAHRSMQVALSAEPPQIRLLDRREVRYGRRLALPYDDRGDPRLAVNGGKLGGKLGGQLGGNQGGYLARAVARGRVDRDDAALLVRYQLRFKAAICGRAQDPPPRVRVPLPRDPWLAYWHVPRDKHRPLRYRGTRAITNPCADDDFADLPHPFYYWYDWLPTRHGRDDDGRAFDCRRWLRPGGDYDYVDVTLDRVGAPSGDLRRLRHQLGGAGAPPLTITVLVGAVDHAVKDLDLPRWQALIGDGVSGTQGALAPRAAAARAAWSASGPRESGTRAYLALLDDLGGAMTVDRHAASVDDGNLVTTVTGRLAHSGRAVRLRLTLGPTDVFGPVPPRHWGLVRRALTEDQIVVYWGHAGIGENLRLSQIERHLDLPHARLAAELARSPLRLVAFLSCYSYMYFGQDLLAVGAARAGGAHFIFTGIGKPRRDAGPLAVLELVDRLLDPANAAGHVTAIPRLGDDELWLLKQVAGDAP